MRGGDAVKYRYFIDPVIAWNIQHYKKMSLGRPRARIKMKFIFK